MKEREIHKAVKENNLKLLKEIIEKKIKKEKRYTIDVCSEFERTPLHLACEGDCDLDIVKCLVEAGADVNSRDLFGYTPLFLLCRRQRIFNHRYRDMVYLLERGADIDAVNKSGETPLEIVSMHNNVDLVEFLLEKGANPEKINPDVYGKLNADIKRLLDPVKSKKDTPKPEEKTSKTSHSTPAEKPIGAVKSEKDDSTSEQKSPQLISASQATKMSIETSKEISQSEDALTILANNFESMFAAKLETTSSLADEVFLKDLKEYAISIKSNTLKELNFSKPQLVKNFENGNYGKVKRLVVLNNGLLATGTDNYTIVISIWDLRTGKIIKRLESKHGAVSGVSALLPMPGDLLAVGYQDYIEIWHVSTGKIVYTFELKTDEEHGYATAFVLHPKGYLIAGTCYGIILIYDLKTRKCLKKLSHSSRDGISILKVLPNESFVSANLSYSDSAIKIWNLKSWECIQTFKGVNSRTETLEVLNDGRLVSGSYDGLQVWKPESDRPLLNISSYDVGNVIALFVLPNNCLAVSTSTSGIKIFDVKTWKCLGQSESNVFYFDVAFSNGYLVAAREKEFILWRLTLNVKNISFLLEALKQNKSIEKLILHNINITDDDLKIFSDLLEINTSLKEIDFNHTQVTEAGIKKFLQKIKRESTLKVYYADTSISLDGSPYHKQTHEREQTRQYHEAFKMPSDSIVVPLSLPLTVDKKSPVTTSPGSTLTSPSLNPDKHPSKEEISKSKSEKKEDTQKTMIDESGAIKISIAIPYSQLTFDRELGRGGFGIVYEGQYQFGSVAIKTLLHQELKDSVIEEFKKEASIMANLRSPFIVSLYGICLEKPHYSLVMEYMASGSLSNFLQNDKPIEWKIRYQIGIDVGAGLAYLHHHEMVHCDLKSLNILLDVNYRAKLSDFGLSKVKLETSFSTVSGGSTRWMAPELFEEGAKSTKSADVFAFGIVLWELGARKFPFATTRNEAVPMIVCKGKREEITKDTPPTMAQLIAKCWDGRIESRPKIEEAVKTLRAEQVTYKV